MRIRISSDAVPDRIVNEVASGILGLLRVTQDPEIVLACANFLAAVPGAAERVQRRWVVDEDGEDRELFGLVVAELIAPAR